VFSLRKPAWLYEVLPYVYVAAGTAIVANLGNVLSTVGGGLLVFAGAFIWWMRRTYRQDRRRREADRREAAHKVDLREAVRRAADLKESTRRRSLR